MADNVAPANKVRRRKQQHSDKQIICMCNEFSLDDMQSMLAENPNISFDRFLADSGVGARCTACLFDLEYYFVDLPREKKTNVDVDYSKPKSTLSLRRRFYQWIDQHSPRQPIRSCEDVPVIAGNDIKQWVWIANYDLLYKKGKSNKVPDFDVELKLYDATGGAPIHQQRVELALGTAWRGELSQYLPQSKNGGSSVSDKELSIGRLEIIRHSKSDGVRGTTRPQIEIATSVSSCAVHGQAAGQNTGSAFDLICHPDDDRVFLSFINPSSSPVDIKLKYPSDPMKKIELPSRDVHITIPPNGAELHEIVLSEEEIEEYRDRLYNFSWHGVGLYKCHVIVASTGLDRFSIDHV